MRASRPSSRRGASPGAGSTTATADDGSEHTPENSTLVEFTLTPEGDSTRLRVVESGFAGLAADEQVRTSDYEGNVRGWKAELGELVEYAEQVAA